MTYLFYSWKCIFWFPLPIWPTLPPASGNHQSISCIYGLSLFNVSMCQWDHIVFVFLRLVSLSITPLKSIHVADGKISFFYGWIIFYCIYLPHFLYSFIHRWALRFFPCLQFSHSVVSDSLRPHELQHARPPCPSPTPGVHPNPCPLWRWCHPAISSSVVRFSSCPQSFPASGSFQMS